MANFLLTFETVSQGNDNYLNISWPAYTGASSYKVEFYDLTSSYQGIVGGTTASTSYSKKIENDFSKIKVIVSAFSSSGTKLITASKTWVKGNSSNEEKEITFNVSFIRKDNKILCYVKWVPIDGVSYYQIDYGNGEVYIDNSDCEDQNDIDLTNTYNGSVAVTGYDSNGCLIAIGQKSWQRDNSIIKPNDFGILPFDTLARFTSLYNKDNYIELPSLILTVYKNNSNGEVVFNKTYDKDYAESTSSYHNCFYIIVDNLEEETTYYYECKYLSSGIYSDTVSGTFKTLKNGGYNNSKFPTEVNANYYLPLAVGQKISFDLRLGEYLICKYNGKLKYQTQSFFELDSDMVGYKLDVERLYIDGEYVYHKNYDFVYDVVQNKMEVDSDSLTADLLTMHESMVTYLTFTNDNIVKDYVLYATDDYNKSFVHSDIVDDVNFQLTGLNPPFCVYSFIQKGSLERSPVFKREVRDKNYLWDDSLTLEWEDDSSNIIGNKLRLRIHSDKTFLNVHQKDNPIKVAVLNTNGGDLFYDWTIKDRKTKEYAIDKVVEIYTNQKCLNYSLEIRVFEGLFDIPIGYSEEDKRTFYFSYKNIVSDTITTSSGTENSIEMPTECKVGEKITPIVTVADNTKNYTYEYLVDDDVIEEGDCSFITNYGGEKTHQIDPQSVVFYSYARHYGKEIVFKIKDESTGNVILESSVIVSEPSDTSNVIVDDQEDSPSITPIVILENKENETYTYQWVTLTADSNSEDGFIETPISGQCGTVEFIDYPSIKGVEIDSQPDVSKITFTPTQDLMGKEVMLNIIDSSGNVIDHSESIDVHSTVYEDAKVNYIRSYGTEIKINLSNVDNKYKCNYRKLTSSNWNPTESSSSTYYQYIYLSKLSPNTGYELEIYYSPFQGSDILVYKRTVWTRDFNGDYLGIRSAYPLVNNEINLVQCEYDKNDEWKETIVTDKSYYWFKDNDRTVYNLANVPTYVPTISDIGKKIGCGSGKTGKKPAYQSYEVVKFDLDGYKPQDEDTISQKIISQKEKLKYEIKPEEGSYIAGKKIVTDFNYLLPSPCTINYHWEESNDGISFSPISGQQSNELVITEDYYNKFVRLKITPGNKTVCSDTGYIYTNSIEIEHINLDKPYVYSASSITHCSAALKWNPVVLGSEDFVEKYAVRYREKNDENWSDPIITGQCSLVLNNLTESTTYEYKITALSNGYNTSDTDSDIKEFDTSEKPGIYFKQNEPLFGDELTVCSTGSSQTVSSQTSFQLFYSDSKDDSAVWTEWTGWTPKTTDEGEILKVDLTDDVIIRGEEYIPQYIKCVVTFGSNTPEDPIYTVNPVRKRLEKPVIDEDEDSKEITSSSAVLSFNRIANADNYIITYSENPNFETNEVDNISVNIKKI